jgi:hypothetical protein
MNPGKHRARAAFMLLPLLCAMLALSAGSAGGAVGPPGLPLDQSHGSPARLAAGLSAAPDVALRINDLQLLGSHNSYKRAMPAVTMAVLRALNTALAESLDYWHPPLTTQLNLGLRKLELDVFFDPDGELFGRGEAAGHDAAGQDAAGQVGAPARSQFPVLHVQNLDDRSNCLNLLVCLAELRAWSDAHPAHIPIFISFNAKDEVVEQPGFLRPAPFGEPAWQALDAELRALLGDRLITPSEVFATGRLAWPTLEASRGRFLLVLDESGDKHRSYVSRWRERAMFAATPTDLLDDGALIEGAAVLVVNDPVADFARIAGWVRAGFIVRTRADAETREARSGDVERRERAFASGAQLVSTDYYQPATHFGTDYQVVLPEGGVARCNPVRRPAGCDGRPWFQ